MQMSDMNKNTSSEGKYKAPWINFHSHVITMISQSAQKSQRLYTNQHLHLVNRTMNQRHCEWTETESSYLPTYLPTYLPAYLVYALSRAVHIDNEVAARIAKASVAFGRLCANVWERNGIKLDTKLKVYKAVVLPTLLYACETWTVYLRHAKRLNHFHLSCLFDCVEA